MSEEENKGSEETKGSEESQSQGATAQDKEIAALKNEAAGNRVLAKELQEKLDKIETDTKAKTDAEAIKNGEAATLLDAQKKELDKVTGRADANETALLVYLEAELDGVTDEVKALIPEGSAADKLTYVNKLKTAGLLKARKIGNGVMDSGEEADSAGIFSEEIKKATTQAELDAIMKKHGRA